MIWWSKIHLLNDFPWAFQFEFNSLIIQTFEIKFPELLGQSEFTPQVIIIRVNLKNHHVLFWIPKRVQVFLLIKISYNSIFFSHNLLNGEFLGVN